MTNHILKCEETPFRSLWDGTKVHESRLNDRGYDVGDSVELHEIRKDGTPTGRRVSAEITYISNEWNSYGAVNRGYVVLSLGEIEVYPNDSLAGSGFHLGIVDDVDDGDYIAERISERDDIPPSPYD